MIRRVRSTDQSVGRQSGRLDERARTTFAWRKVCCCRSDTCLSLYDVARRALHRRPPSGASERRFRRRTLGARIQIRPGSRTGALLLWCFDGSTSLPIDFLCCGGFQPKFARHGNSSRLRLAVSFLVFDPDWSVYWTLASAVPLPLIRFQPASYHDTLHPAQYPRHCSPSPSCPSILRPLAAQDTPPATGTPAATPPAVQAPDEGQPAADPAARGGRRGRGRGGAHDVRGRPGDHREARRASRVERGTADGVTFRSPGPVCDRRR